MNENTYIDFSKEPDKKYRSLLQAEYRYIKSIKRDIRKNAVLVYNHKLKNSNATSLSKRCNNFKILEAACRDYNKTASAKS